MSLFLRLVACLATLSAVVGCGGGSDNASEPEPAQSSRNATVGVLLTDAPTDEFSEILATVTSIRLLGSDRQIVLFSGNETVDLLRLESFSDLFAVAGDVPPGSYTKVRLTLSDLVLVRRDASGALIERIRPTLPGGGRLDLDLRDAILLSRGETAIIEIDIDARKSFHAVGTGAGGFVFRPVAFVHALRDGVSTRLARVHGEITDIDSRHTVITLCASAPVAAMHHDDDDHDHDHCVRVDVSEDTGLFGETGDAIEFADLREGDEATAVGRLHRLDDEDDDEDSDSDSDSDSDDDEDSDSDRDHRRVPQLAMDAVVVEHGPLGSFARLKGIVETPVGVVTNSFELALAPAQGFEPGAVIDVLLQDGTRIFSRDGEELDASAIEPDQRARVDGVLRLSSTDPDRLKAALVVVELDADADNLLMGTIQSSTARTRSLIVSTASGDRCVRVSSNARIFLVDEDNSGFSSERAEFEDLGPGMRIRAFGREAHDGCFEAALVVAETEN